MENSAVIPSTDDLKQGKTARASLPEHYCTEVRAHSAEGFAQATVDALTAHIVVVDKSGIILTVNKAWKEFARANGAKDMKNIGPGTNYLQVCEQSADTSEDACAFASGIRAVLKGEIDSFEREYPCTTPEKPLWFNGRVARFGEEKSPHLVISHENITDRKLAEAQYASQQSAVALENQRLLENLQASNLRLAQAYDATIEGWARALDLRDHDTEGHCRRVTEITLRLAHTLELPEAELIYVRWGALLHDIGKMGIPDSILLKPGTFTPEERAVMETHTTLALEMLTPISFLQSALDIPYCHHEKWDGSGYPRGLKGEEIPFAARLFAVADVWDALRSDRPYRKGWPEAKVRAYIRRQAGTHFDPRVVQAFLSMEPVF